MRKPDLEVREVVCSETGKPMTKIPMWMADVKVKFVSDEARSKHPTVPGLVDVDPMRRAGARGTVSDGAADDVDEETDRDSDTDDDSSAVGEEEAEA